MGDELNRHSGDPHYEETTAPQNPPTSMVRKESRSAWFWSSVGTLALVFLVVGTVFAWIWGQRALGGGDRDRFRSDPQTEGTSGERQPREDSPGGFNTEPSLRDAREELDYRGGAWDVTKLADFSRDRVDSLAGRRVRLDNVTVDRADGNVFWVRDGDVTAPVVTSGNMPTVKAGQRVNVMGSIDVVGNAAQIRASRIEVR